MSGTKKMFKQSEQKEPLKCPRCGRKCMILETWPNGDFMAQHEYGMRLITSSATFNTVHLQVLLDGCTQDGPIGHNHKKTDQNSEPMKPPKAPAPKPAEQWVAF